VRGEGNGDCPRMSRRRECGASARTAITFNTARQQREIEGPGDRRRWLRRSDIPARCNICRHHCRPASGCGCERSRATKPAESRVRRRSSSMPSVIRSGCCEPARSRHARTYAAGVSRGPTRSRDDRAHSLAPGDDSMNAAPTRIGMTAYATQPAKSTPPVTAMNDMGTSRAHEPMPSGGRLGMALRTRQRAARGGAPRSVRPTGSELRPNRLRWCSARSHRALFHSSHTHLS
jgi:hypothetical protein